VHVAATSRPNPNGQTSVLERTRRLPNTRVYPAEFGPSLHGSTRATLRELVRDGAGVPYNFLKLVRYVRKNGIHVIHASQKPQDAAFAASLATLTRRKCVLHLHVKYGDWMTRPVKLALKRADLVLGVSRFAADSAVRGSLAIDPARVAFVHNALEANGWDAGVDGDSVRKELEIGPDDRLIGSVGRLNQWKGQAELIDAMPRILERQPRAVLLLVGEEDAWSHGSAGYRRELEARAERLGVAGQVRFLGFRRDVKNVMAALDVFAFPTWEEPFGMVFLEAMALAKPVVAIDSGAAPEIVAHEVTGLIVPPRDAERLADAISRLLGDPGLRERFGQAGRERVRTLLNPRQSAEKLGELYEQLVS
jgi:glycosyltransferase involved in cell wall biosynthesis